MANPYGANQYKQMAVKTASPPQILIMLYEAAIKNVKKASACLDAKDIAGKGIHIGKAHDIINELNNSLNFEIGGQVARDLERLYNYLGTELVKANLENDKSKLDAVAKVLDTLLGGWRVAVEQVQKGVSANK